jgi:hypothetical protein
MAKKRTKKNRLARKLLSYALDELYCFEDDEIENELDIAILKFKGKHEDWRKQVRAYIFSKQALREKIAAIAIGMFR